MVSTFRNTLIVALSTGAVVLAPSAFAIDVSTLAEAFQTDVTGAMAVIGGAMVAAGFVAITWKWIKAMLFGG